MALRLLPMAGISNSFTTIILFEFSIITTFTSNNNITNKKFKVKRNEMNFSTITSIETRTINIVLKHKINLIINYS